MKEAALFHDAAQQSAQNPFDRDATRKPHRKNLHLDIYLYYLAPKATFSLLKKQSIKTRETDR